MSGKCAACDVAGIVRRAESAPLLDTSDCLQLGLCNDWLKCFSFIDCGCCSGKSHLDRKNLHTLRKSPGVHSLS